ncbi:hypothetical protein A0257_20970 [Hymenobacter psoromatis]|nr:hypothetical protein A0257_20970 [Hymenobacter psoromatis]
MLPVRQYSIRELAQYSGIKAHTIRTWELRYDLLQPRRTATNIRYYDEQDLRRLLHVASLCGHGQRISRVMRLSEQERAQAVLALAATVPDNHEAQLNALTLAMLDLDEPLLHRLLTAAISQHGPESAMLQLVYPLLQRIGLAWQVGMPNVAQEHLVSQLVRQKLLALLDALPAAPPAGAPRWLLFLPEGELHELALLFLVYALRTRGQQVLYLGQNLPLAAVAAACQSYRPAALLTVLTAGLLPEEVTHYAADLRQQCPEPQLIFYGPLTQQLRASPPLASHLPPLITDVLELIPVVSRAAGG